MVWPAVIAAAAAIGSSYMDNKSNQGLSNKEYWNQRKLLALQNEYNKPVNQMRRLQEAGLNPSLVYSQSSSGVTGNQVSAGSAPHLSSSNYASNAVDRFFAIKNADKDLQMKDQQILQERANEPYYRSNAYIQSLHSAAQYERTKSEDKVLKAEALVKSADAKYRDAEARILKHDADLADLKPGVPSKVLFDSSLKSIPKAWYDSGTNLLSRGYNAAVDYFFKK